MSNQPNNIHQSVYTGHASRRAFLKMGSALSVTGAAAPWALNLSTIGAAAAQSATDYKAIVCFFLFGGNDYANTVIPYDAANYALYQGLRPNLATPLANLAGTALASTTGLPAGRQYALAPELSPLVPHFNAGKAAVMLNLGTLRQPTTKAQYTAKSVPLPPKLFSHNDQQSNWQSGLAEGATSGWGGRIGDLVMANNGISTFTSISVAGNAVFLSGQSTLQYQVTSNGSVAIGGISGSLYGSTAAAATLKSLISASASSNLLEVEHAKITNRSIAANTTTTAALASVPTLATPFGSDSLSNQAKLVARLIGARGVTGAKRQVFFVSLGGFDLHDSLPGKHPGLLTQVGNAMSAFYKATIELGIADKVTAFSASDFGRTLTGNNDGSDHGWGSMHFVVGGAVNGNRFYGTAPAVANNGPDDVGQGRLLPTTSVDQLAATLATWFGVAASDLPTVVPNIANFSTKNLGVV